MKVTSFRMFEGRNIYSHKKCIRLNLDLEGYSQIPSKDIYDFNKNLVYMLPELTKHKCRIDEDREFTKGTTAGTHLAHITEHIIIVLHDMIGLEVRYGTSRGMASGDYYVIFQYEYRNTSIEASNIAVDMLNSLINKKPFHLNLRLERLKEMLANEQLSVSTLNICNEAKKRGIPILRIGEDGMFQLGYGRHSKVIKGTMDSNISIGAVNIDDRVFKDLSTSIPLVSVTGTNGKTTTTRLIAHILSIAGYTVGMTTTGGIYIDGKCIFEGDTTGPKSALDVLMNKNIDAAVLETARGGIIREGLAYDLADVAVITNITEDHIGLDEVESIEDLAKVKALVAEAVKKDGYVVINGDDNMSISISQKIKCNLIIFSNNKDNEVMHANIKNGGYGVYVDKESIIIQKNNDLKKLIDIKNIGITINGILKYNIENAMAACCAALGLGIGYDIIKQGLSSFYCNKDQNPGRFNMYFINDVMIILDYGHNIDGYRCVLDGLKCIKHNKLIGIIGVPGDRTDSHILELGKCAGENFDYIFIKENKDGRGRSEGEVAELLEKGALSSKIQSMNIEKILKETEAFKMALDIAKPGDIVIIFFEKLQPLIDILTSKIEGDKCETSQVNFPDIFY